MRNMKTTYKISVGNPERKRPFGRYMPTIKDSIRTDLT
jgi:hypothetical protein